MFSNVTATCRPPSRRRPRVGRPLCVALLVLAATGCSRASSPQITPEQARAFASVNAAAAAAVLGGPAASPSASASASAPVSAAESPSLCSDMHNRLGRSAGATGEHVVLLGDSYVYGEKTSRRTDLVGLLATRMRVTAFGLLGDTFADGGTCGVTYASQVPAVIASRPDRVVLEGGLDDASLAPANVAADAQRLITSLQAGLPGVPIVLVGPGNPLGVSTVAVTAVDGALRQLATTDHLAYVSWMGVLTATLTDRDQRHPDTAGYAALVARLLPAL